jgi:integrase
MGNHKIRHLVERDGAFYFQATRPMRDVGMVSEKLGVDRAAAIARAETLNKQWDKIRTGADYRETGTVNWLADRYEKHRWYRDLSKKGKQEADTALKDIRAALGNATIETVTPRIVDEFIETLMDTRSADVARRRAKYLRRIFMLALKLELVKQNPVVSIDVKGYSPRRIIWTTDQISTFIQTATEMDLPGIALAIQLCYDTMQRPGDVLRATWNDIDAGGLCVRQGKTGMDVWCPLDLLTLTMLEQTQRRSTQIVTTPSGKAYSTYSYFASHFRQVREAAGLPDELRVQDLRRTAGTEISAGGGRIEPLSGHQPNSPTARVYIVPNRGAALESQKARQRGRDRTKV